MNDQPKTDPKSRARRLLRDLPIAAASYGIGYGLARTALEGMGGASAVGPLAAAMGKQQGAGPLRQYLPVAMGAAAAVAGLKLDNVMRSRVLEGK